ncbi:MAG TPA: putative glycolipid-binding domain-containing protein [Methylomirabilota bacterium]|nr:putative glycolipid-binding domain-containing protein [Methylomirabilota bacterium]
MWDTHRSGTGLEHLLLREGSADSVLLAFDEQGRPFRLAYQLAWDAAWRLGEARLQVTSEHGTRSLHLQSDGKGRWTDGGGRALSELDGCLDIDIWPTPFTNTFPIRRQPLAVGERREFVMAWVSAPALTVRPMRQGYTRLGDRRYLYENLEGSGFRAELPVDEDGVVLDYQGVFRRAA